MGLIYLQLVVMTVLQLVPERKLTCFWCSTALIYSNSRKKRRVLNQTLNHIVFPVTYLLLNAASVLKVYWLQSPHSEPNIKNSCRVSVPQRHVYYLPKDTAVWRYSFSVISALCSFFYIHASEGHTTTEKHWIHLKVLLILIDKTWIPTILVCHVWL